ncbi:hypothetical protein K1719_040424 [Acacia pycnantha]|nr:hypothetical protein K1719_040424 [Acacia pycnantha]
MKEIIQILSDKSNEIKVLGIHGMGGIGKTTPAKAIYNEVGKDYEAKSFLAYIKEASELENDLVHLQEQLLSNIFPKRRMTLHSIEIGKGIMKERLCGKKALIVLDSVTNKDQLDALFGSREWYGPGSRIIITTRDEHILDIIQADNVYEMKEMNDNESLELFSWHAFKQESPIEGFIDVSKSVTAYSEGLPLALEVLGAYLCDRPMEDWICAMDRLKEIPDHQIHKKLKIGYDGLSYDYEKDIFLDICCFFIGKDRNYVTQILNGCGLYADIGITRLSLLRVDKNNKLGMHGLIRDMGREIVREESLKEHGNRSRLWSQNTVIHVLRNFRGTTNVNGLALNLSRTETQSFDTKGFEKMESLRLLQLRHLLAPYFYLENAVAIDLRYSHLTQVWKNCQLLEKLKILNLSHSYKLSKMPTFSRLPNLEKLILEDCPRLSSIHESIGDLKCLILANFKGCKDLRLPRDVFPILIQSWVTPRTNARSLLHGIAASMPFLLPHLFSSSLNLWSRIMKRIPYKFHISKAHALDSSGFHDQVDTAEAANFSGSLAIHLKSTFQVFYLPLKSS